MTKKRRPSYRVTIARKDGEDIEFTNYKGETVEKKYMPMGVLFKRDKGEGFSLLIDSAADGMKLDTETYWFNVYPVDEDDAPRGRRDERPRGNGKRSSGKPSGRKTDEELSFD